MSPVSRIRAGHSKRKHWKWGWPPVGIAYSAESGTCVSSAPCIAQDAPYLELEWVLVGAGVDRKASLGVRSQVFRAHIRREQGVRLVQELVDFEYRTLLIGPGGMYWREQSRLRLPLELHDDAADVGGIRHPQHHLSLYDIEICVMLVRMLKSYRDVHVCCLMVIAVKVRDVLREWKVAESMVVEGHITVYELMVMSA